MPAPISPPAAPPPPTLDPAVAALVRAKARQVAARCRLRPADRDDAGQDLALHVWPRLGRFDPDLADPGAFARMLVARAVATLLRRRRGRRATGPSATAMRLGEGDVPDPRSGPLARRRPHRRWPWPRWWPCSPGGCGGRPWRSRAGRSRLPRGSSG